MTQDATDKDFDLTDYLEDLLRPDQGEIEKNISKVDDHHLLIEEEEYQVLVDHANGYRYDAFYDRYQDFFAKYDYIVGDWASDQLRLRGFYQIGTPKVPYDQRIETLEDYLNEYCNFGASYFVIGKTKSLLDYPQLTEDFRAGKFASLPSKSRNQKRSFATKSPHYKKNQRNHRKRSSQSSHKDRSLVQDRETGKGKNNFKLRQNDRQTRTSHSNRNTKTHKGHFTIKQKKS